MSKIKKVLTHTHHLSLLYYQGVILYSYMNLEVNYQDSASSKIFTLQDIKSLLSEFKNSDNFLVFFVSSVFAFKLFKIPLRDKSA